MKKNSRYGNNNAVGAVFLENRHGALALGCVRRLLKRATKNRGRAVMCGSENPVRLFCQRSDFGKKTIVLRRPNVEKARQALSYI
jgi:hypothetical protein